MAHLPLDDFSGVVIGPVINSKASTQDALSSKVASTSDICPMVLILYLPVAILPDRYGKLIVAHFFRSS